MLRVPSWDDLLETMTGDLRPLEWRDSGEWAIRELRARLGEDWTSRSWTRYGLPSGFGLAGFHTIAHCELLELALRLSLLNDVHGRGKVQKALRGDAASSQLMHARIQLEVAAIAQQMGRPVAMESREISAKDPVDLLVDRTPVETFAVLDEDRDIDHRDAVDEMLDWLLHLGIAHDIHLTGQIHTVLDKQDRHLLEQDVKLAANGVRAGQGEQTLEHENCELVVVRREDAAGRPLSGPTSRKDGWRKPRSRLLKKADQALSSGATWLRCDIRTGLWQFTELRKLSLADRATQLGMAVRQTLASYSHIDGVVLSCGSLQAQGRFEDETATGASNELALRRPIFPLRVREAVVIPLTTAGMANIGLWHAIYDNEPRWFAWALATAGLPTSEAIYASKN